jgi:DNA-binding transcriptional LysR family regulator
MVEANLGVALVPDHHAARYAAAGNLVTAVLNEPWAVRQWQLCSREPRSLPAPVRLLLDHLSSRVKAREPVRIMPPPRVVAMADYVAASARN